MKQIFFNYGCVLYNFFLYTAAVVVLIIVTIINLPGLFRRKEAR